MVNDLIRLRVALKTNANSMQIFQYFFDNFFVFSQWQLIFYISNMNTRLYRFLLKFFNFGIYTSLPFLVRFVYVLLCLFSCFRVCIVFKISCFFVFGVSEMKIFYKLIKKCCLSCKFSLRKIIIES